jgi:hypothetical protein
VKRVFGVGKMRLRGVATEDCQRLVLAALSRGHSVQHATHIRNAISAIFEHAESKDRFSGRNPARRVKLPKKSSGAAVRVDIPSAPGGRRGAGSQRRVARLSAPRSLE